MGMQLLLDRGARNHVKTSGNLKRENYTFRENYSCVSGKPSLASRAGKDDGPAASIVVPPMFLVLVEDHGMGHYF